MRALCNKLFILIIFCLSFGSSAQISFNWAKSFSGLLGAKSSGGLVSTDIQGNIYSYGSFINTVDFDPGPGTYTLNTLGYAPYLTKFDASGQVLVI